MALDNVLERAAWLLDGSGDAGLITDLNGVIEYVNPAFETLTGYDREQALGRNPAILKSGQQTDQFYRELWSGLHAGREFHGVLVNRRHDGGLFHEEKTIRPIFGDNGSVQHYMACGRDVSERVAALDKLRHDATHDGLTGLPNRTLYLDRLEQAVVHAARSGERLAVGLVDLNGFKAINDSAGHDVGDAALRATARRLERCLRQSDTAARLGGDEFALLLHDTDGIERVMDALMQTCSEPFGPTPSEKIPLSVSVGISFFPDDGDTASTLLRRADEAMYTAKRMGAERSRWTVASPEPKPMAKTPGEAGMSAMDILERELPVLRRVLKPGNALYRAGDKFTEVHILRVGLCKLTGYCAEGREDLITILFKGDWLGFDGLADGRHHYTAVSADVCEVLTVSYDSLVRAVARNPALLGQMHAAIARQHTRERDAVLNMHALPADGRVAAFLCRWADELELCGLRSDQITLPTTRAEIGGHVGLRLESVSRAMSNLERERLIRFGSRNRRDIEIPSLLALRSYVSRLVDGR
jgi:diguanylate cyclase (GGDEF)-like protein/PAS domain S-box-containing protein